MDDGADMYVGRDAYDRMQRRRVGVPGTNFVENANIPSGELGRGPAVPIGGTAPRRVSAGVTATGDYANAPLPGAGSQFARVPPRPQPREGDVPVPALSNIEAMRQRMFERGELRGYEARPYRERAEAARKARAIEERRQHEIAVRATPAAIKAEADKEIAQGRDKTARAVEEERAAVKRDVALAQIKAVNERFVQEGKAVGSPEWQAVMDAEREKAEGEQEYEQANIILKAQLDAAKSESVTKETTILERDDDDRPTRARETTTTVGRNPLAEQMRGGGSDADQNGVDDNATWKDPATGASLNMNDVTNFLVNYEARAKANPNDPVLSQYRAEYELSKKRKQQWLSEKTSAPKQV
jgi:hypothetical protein